MNSPTTSEQKDPAFSDEYPNLTTEDEEKQLKEDQNPPQPQNPQFPKTVTLEIPDADEPPLHGDPNQGNREEITPLSPTFTYSRRGFGGGGGGRRKKRSLAQEKKSQEKLETLAGKLNLVPFKPVKTLDFSSHEALLRRLRLWDFAHLDFDFRLHRDLILQLIASFSPSLRASKVNEVRIKVSRIDLARALCLPEKKEKVENAVEVKESDESVSFIEEFVLTFLLLHGEDTWMMPDDIHSTMKLIKDGNFEKVDFATLLWRMVEKELSNSELENCYYASHLQLLIKAQREDILKIQEPVKMEIGLKEDEDERGGEEVPKMGEEHELARGSELEEHDIELSLGGADNAVNHDGMMELKEQSDNGEDYAMDFEESKEEDEQGQWVNNTMDGHFLQRCNFGGVGSAECEEERKQQEEGDGEEEGYEEEEEDEGKEGEYEEEEEGEEMRFSISPNDVAMEGENSENLIEAIEASQHPFSSGMQNRDNLSSSVDFFTSRVDSTVQTIPCGSSLFNNNGNNGSKRAVEHLENDVPNHSLYSGNKRLRSDGHWDNMKSPSELDIYMEEMQHVMGKVKMHCNSKDQAYQGLNMQHQLLLSEFEERTNMVHSLNKAKMEEEQKRQVETYRFEHELYMMGNLLDRYRKALKETTKAFAEYRKKCPLPEEPIYKDTGSGGLVLSSTELEKLRLKREEEERQNMLLNVKKIKEFQAHWIPKFEAWESFVESLSNKLRNVEKEVNFCKEGIPAKRKKAAEMSECAPSEEHVTQQFEIADCAPSEEQVTQLVEMSECAPSEEQVTQQVEMSECAPSEEQATEQVEMSECAPTEEQVTQQFEIPECAPTEEQVTEQVEMSECAPSEEQVTQQSV